jgi:hypothetical protein
MTSSLSATPKPVVSRSNTQYTHDLKSTCTGGGALGLNCHDACVEDYSLFE